ncbi:hypothetical protein B4119_0890 [Parageobacillus caldoxylosilyticus]|uniref:Uncharacterized protein n=1 Tax=Saccharococcus caldoxylosilyticus TaxID=81408 RepID=A0A150LE98_9BACL|nr:hypothetical protein B4119_0890 [Parageobacillus caldoxylosilyticus]
MSDEYSAAAFSIKSSIIKFRFIKEQECFQTADGRTTIRKNHYTS